MPTKTLAIASLMLLGMVAYSSLSAQEAEPTTKSDFKGRLPAYWGDIVTNDQRAKIYEIQKEYDSQIDKLKAEIEKLEDAMKKEFASVLTKPQLDRIKEMAAEEELRRQKNEAAKKAAAAAAASN
ncbi:hypothetical protein [Bremerella cremea]|uniref:hypothetical protein n=1 Tax=Bremerella cremea TaxID=1031537 RepID=UPI0031EC5B2E